MSISARIARDLKKRLRFEQPLSTPLTLDALSAHYDVSVTPVRAAIAELLGEGVLIKGANRRLIPSPAATDPGESAAARDGDDDGDDGVPVEPPGDLLKRIEHDLVGLSLSKQAVPLREEAAARRYGISRSSLRNILNRLAGRGLLMHLPRRGWQVRPFRKEDMESFLDVRALLEVKALELAQDRLDPAVIRKILDGNRPPAIPGERPQVDNSLHAYIIVQARNPYIQDFFDRHGRYYEILFAWEDLDEEALLEAIQQHRQILEAILRKDWDSARAALAWHIRSNHPVLRSLTRRQAAEDDSNDGAPE